MCLDKRWLVHFQGRQLRKGVYFFPTGYTDPEWIQKIQSNPFLAQNFIFMESYGCWLFFLIAQQWNSSDNIQRIFFFFYIVGYQVTLFLFLQENICCGYSLEAPRWGASNEYQQHIFSWRNKKKYQYLFCWNKKNRLIWGFILRNQEKILVENASKYRCNENIWNA